MNLSFLKKVGHVAEEIGIVAGPAAASIFLGPAVGAMVNTAIHSIVDVSQKLPTATGEEKKAAVMSSLEAVAPQVQGLLTSMGVSVKDAPKFADGADQLVEALLNMCKATGTVPSTSVPAVDPNVPTDTSTGGGYSASPNSVVMTKNMDKPVVVYVRGVDQAIVG